MVVSVTPQQSVSPEERSVDECLYLTGRPTLREFLRYVRTHATTQPGKGTLTDEWHAAHDIVRELAATEAGCADDPSMAPLGPEYEGLLLDLLKDPLVRFGFNTVPTDVALVELDRLVVYQKHIDLAFARRLEQTLVEIFHGEGTILTFWSAAACRRFLGRSLLRPPAASCRR